MSVKQLMMISLSALAMACAPKEPVKYLALSFDDGPNLTTESKMLDVLAKHDVPATFFFIGNNINEETAENMKRALELGCEDWVDTVDKDTRREGIIANAEPGAIYLLHDFEGNEATVEALDEAIPVLKEQGYVFLTVAQLFEKLNCTPDGHTIYTVVPDKRN